MPGGDGREVDVVAYCNYPLLRTDHWPIRRLGHSVPHILQHALDLLARQQQGAAMPRSTVLTPVFPEELAGVLPARNMMIS